MIATSGDRLLAPDAVDVLKRVLIPRALVITPNLPEAAALLDAPIAGTEAEMRRQAERLLALGPRAVLIKGGHGSGAESVDLLVEPSGIHPPRGGPHRDPEYPRHRLHAVVGDRGRPRQGPRPGRGGGRRQEPTSRPRSCRKPDQDRARVTDRCTISMRGG